MRHSFLILIAILSSLQSFARFRPVPLMPLRDTSSESFVSSLEAERNRKARSQLTSIGLELGTVGFSSENSPDLLGVQALFGLRANFQYPIWNKYFLKPSIGYWTRPEHAGAVTVTQNVMEGGLGFHQILNRQGGRMTHVGINTRLDYLFSNISVGDSSAKTPANFRFRVGAAAGVKWVLSSDLDFTIDAEAGIPLQKPMKAYVGFTTGLVFLLK